MPVWFLYCFFIYSFNMFLQNLKQHFATLCNLNVFAFGEIATGRTYWMYLQLLACELQKTLLMLQYWYGSSTICTRNIQTCVHEKACKTCSHPNSCTVQVCPPHAEGNGVYADAPRHHVLLWYTSVVVGYMASWYGKHLRKRQLISFQSQNPLL